MHYNCIKFTHHLAEIIFYVIMNFKYVIMFVWLTLTENRNHLVHQREATAVRPIPFVPFPAPVLIVVVVKGRYPIVESPTALFVIDGVPTRGNQNPA